MRTILLIAVLSVLLGGCGTDAHQIELAQAQERMDDSTCRGFLQNKSATDKSTYAECRTSLRDMKLLIADSVYVPLQPNVTVIVNQP